jgi:molybdate transport system permease protein
MTRRLPLPVAAVAALAAAFLVLPVGWLIGRALVGGIQIDESVLAALRLSLLTTAISLLLTIGFGTPLAWVLARRRLPAHRLLEALVDLPIVLPPAVAGLALLLFFGRRGPAGNVGAEIAFTTLAVILAQTFVSAPFFVRSARGAFATVHRDLEDAARIDGGGEWSVFRRVTVPLAMPVLVGGAILAWARALGEFGATIMFAGNVTGVTQTLPLAVYAEFQSSLDASIAAAAILVVAALAVLVGVHLVRADREQPL